MAIRGGYQIVDFKNNPFTSGTASNIEGVYTIAKSIYHKPTLISGLKVGNVFYPDFFATFMESNNTLSTSVTIGGSSITIAIDNTNNVTVTVE